jgi:4-hydroxy-4-methyl-2-oxoglutarate aldolase
MRTVIVTGVPRADLGIVDELATVGTATVHEAIGRAGCLGPGLRPIQDGARTGGTAVTAWMWQRTRKKGDDVTTTSVAA